MKVECVKDRLAEAVQKAEKFTGKNLTLPILSCIYIEAEKNGVVIRATNLELGIEIRIPAKVSEEGKIAVPGSTLSNFLSHLYHDKNVNLESEEGSLVVSTPHSSTTIKTQPTEDFPLIPKVEGEVTLSLHPDEILNGIRSVWYSAAVSSMKPELSSIYMYHDGDDSLVFVATDSFRLAEKRIRTKKGKELGKVLIPFKNAGEIVRVLDGVKDDVEVSLGNGQIAFQYDHIYVVSRVIDGTFPDYEQIIPKEAKTEVVVIKKDLLNSLKLANVFSDQFNQITFTIKPEGKKFELRTKNNDVGETVDSVEAVVKGEDIHISFNYKYIADCFQSLSSDSVNLSFNGLGKPLVIRGISDKSFLYLVMPMNK